MATNKFKDPVVAAIFGSASADTPEKPLPKFPVRNLDPKENAAIREHVFKYAHADYYEAWKVVFVTVVLYFGAIASYSYLPVWFWVCFRAATLVRCFIVQHDCGHKSFFPSFFWNKWVGILTGSMSFTPMEHWSRGHHIHHRITGDLDQEDPGKTILWTNREFARFSPFIKRVVRVLRDPFVFPVAASTFFFMIRFRFPDIKGSYYTNAYKAVELYLLHRIMGNKFMVHEFIASVLSAVIGTVLFHYQHSVNTGYGVRHEEFDSDTASILGSTHLPIPFFLKWATLGIEYHHIHHYSSLVPCYYLQKCHEEAPAGMWKDVTYVDTPRLIRSFFNVQWNEDTRMYESFPEYEVWLQKLFPGI